uniref:WD repeat domain 21 n=1 Tax=Gadus morhua TaxID=8049 RepID=A0A8C5BQZ5_GADMO
MRKWNSREERRSRRRQGAHRNDWYRDNRQSAFENKTLGSDNPVSLYSRIATFFRHSLIELPGFYFDVEKNRYFRLLPGHNNCNPLTKEQLQEKEREKHRARLLSEDDQPFKKAPRVGLNTALLLQKRRVGLLPSNSYCRYGDSASERVFTVNDVSHGGCKYGIMNFKGCSRGSLAVEMCDNLYFTNRKVNSICWASVNHPDSHVLLCLVGMADTPGCVSLLPASLFSNSNPEQPGMLCSFKISAAWSCAWCLNPQADKSFSTGLSRRIIVQDAEARRTQTYSVTSDVLAQQFAVRAPVLFNGCRSGEMFSIDLRVRGRRGGGWKSSRFHQESAITSVRLLQDENYLLAADMLGQIKLWDVRATKPVREYKGHHNEHAYLPIHVNEAEGLLLAVGQDCYTRLWSLQDGQLLRTIPSPHPAAKDLIPSVVFSSQLGGRRGLPGLLMAVKHDLYYFSYNTDPQDTTTRQPAR